MKKEMGKKIVKVFTKYDSVPSTIVVPFIPPLEECELSEDTEATCGSPFETKDYNVDCVEEGLEDVKFIHYKEEIEKDV